MTTKFITPTNEHIGKTVEVSDYGSKWVSRKLVHILPEEFDNRFVCASNAQLAMAVNWRYARITVPKTYAELQEESGLKVGDWVKVIRTAKDFENDWVTAWCKSMNDYVGKIFQIHDICHKGILFKEDGYKFPYFVLEKTEKPETKEEKIDKLIRLFKEELVKIL